MVAKLDDELEEPFFVWAQNEAWQNALQTARRHVGGQAC